MVDSVTVYHDACCKHRRDFMNCKEGNARKFRSFRVLELSEDGRYVKVEGMGNMHWLTGWINLLSGDDKLIMAAKTD